MVSRKLSRQLPILVIAVTVVWAGSAAPSATLLRWKLKTGDQFHVEMHQNTKQTVTTAGKTMEIPQTMVMQMTWTVAGVDEKGVIRMVQSIDRVTMKMQPPGKPEVTYDSAAKEPPTGVAQMLASAFSPMVGVKITQTMTDRGKVLDVDIPETAVAKAQSNPMLKQFFSKEALKDLMGKASPEFPEQAIDSGYQWKTDVETKSPIGQMKIHSTYTYEGRENQGDRQLDRIGVVLEMAIEGDGALGAKVKIIEQDNAGKAYFDTDHGYFAGSKMVQKIKMEVAMLGNTMQQAIETTQQMTVTPAAKKE